MNVDDFQPSLISFGKKGHQIDYSGGNVELSTAVKGVVVTTAGSVVYRPRGETANVITFPEVLAGYILPHIPGVIIQTGTDAVLATIED